MKSSILAGISFLVLACNNSTAQSFMTTFEKSNGKQTATYFECIDYYKMLAQSYPTIKIRTGDTTDAGYPLHVVLFSADKNFNITVGISNIK
jgi:hypothetical protein